jgi:ATP-dependent RNA helicase RhlE
MSFESLGLRTELIRAVSDKGYDSPTPIQKQAIPLILEGRDMMGSAQTGTGKTAGFTLPILQRLCATPWQKQSRRPIRALVVTPTRELAAQVSESI